MRRPSSSERFAAALFAIPILATLASGLVGPLNLTPKYLMVASSGTVLLMATGLATLRVAPLRRALSFAAVLGCLSHTLMLKTANAREDYRYAAERVIESWRPGDLVLVVSGTYGGWSEAPVRHYLRDRADILASVRDWSAIEPRSKSIWDATQRIHVIYREAGYSANAIAAVRKLGTMEREEPIRWRIQYLRLSN